MDIEGKTTAIYKMDLKSNQIIFLSVGVWADYLSLHKLYSPEELKSVFEENILVSEGNVKIETIFKMNKKSLEEYQIGEKITSSDFLARTPENNKGEWFSSFSILGADGKLLGNIRNIHEQKTVQLETEYRASHDQLTGLYNRRTFELKFKELLNAHGFGCLGIFDIDDFKHLNDEYGHIYGDSVLVAISDRLREILPEEAVCGRFGGDEFLVFYPGLSERKYAETKAELLTDQLSELKLEGIPISISTGFAFSPECGVDMVGLLNHADIALRFSKKTGKNRYSFYSKAIERIVAEEELELETDNSEMENGRFAKSSATSKIRGIIALISAVVLVGAISVGFLYERAFKDVMMKESYVYLHEISSQLSMDFNLTMEGYESGAETLATLAEKESWADIETLNKWLNTMCRTQGFERVSLLDNQGILYGADGGQQEVEKQLFFTDVTEQKKPRFSKFQEGNDKESIALGYPLQVRTETGTQCLGMVAVLDGQMLRKKLSLTSFDGAGKSRIITAGGDIVLQELNEERIFGGTNLFEILERAQLNGSETLEEVRSKVLNGESAQIHYDLEEENKIATLTPVGVENWYLVTILKTSFVYNKSSAFSRLTIISCFLTGLVFLLLLLLGFAIWERGRKKLLCAAYMDPVTGGDNLVKFIQKVPQCMQASGYENAMLYANIVGFKGYNDRLGRAGADLVLRKVWEMMQEELGRGECMGRLMADHFGIFVKAESLQEVINRIEGWNYAMSKIGSKEKEPYTLELNYGIYFIDDPKLEIQQMLDRANLARQSLADNQRDHKSYGVYDKKLKDQLLYENVLSNHMQTALENREFKMYLQGQYGLLADGFVGAEALVRWFHPTLGMITPGNFIPLFEKNGFIEKLDLYMFGEACKWIQNMIDLGMEPITISVNISTAHFQTPHFMDAFYAEWKKYGFAPSLLELEFTETMMYGKMEEFKDIIDTIHEMGFLCAMDDFGSGYSSLNELGSLPLDVIKLDRNFFIDSDRTMQRQMTVCYAIQLIKALNMRVVAEGVEKQEQVEWLKTYGCDMIQGYVFAKPVDADEFLKMLNEFAPVF